MKLFPFFSYDNHFSLVYCSDIDGLMKALDFSSNVSSEWWLFINSLKAVLLPKSNMYPALPVRYSIDGKESYKTLSKLLELINYSEFK